MLPWLIDPLHLEFWLGTDAALFGNKAEARRALRAVRLQHWWVYGLGIISVVVLGRIVLHWLRSTNWISALIHQGIPRWVLCLVAVVFGLMLYGVNLIIVWLFRHRMRRHLHRQLRVRGVPVCEVCGYDMRGNTSGLCPECGVRNEGVAHLAPYQYPEFRPEERSRLDWLIPLCLVAVAINLAIPYVNAGKATPWLQGLSVCLCLLSLWRSLLRIYRRKKVNKPGTTESL